jgi:hypothetical protein
MSIIGYCNFLHDFLMAEIEVLDSDYNLVKNTIYYETNKCKVVRFFDMYDNEVKDEDMNNNVKYQIYKYFPNVYKEYEFRFTLLRQICLEQLREKLFFTKSESIFVQDEDDSNIEDEHNIYPIGTRFNIYKKKDNVNINFSGLQNIYKDDGHLFIKFFHNNGIKEGVYKVYTGYENGLKIVVMDFVNDIMITKPVKRLKLESE